MDSPSLHILEVGHGNCSVLVDTDGVVVIDGGPDDHLRKYLRRQRIKVVDTVLISHADADHLAGLIGVLMEQEISVGRVYLNSDSIKRTRVWEDFRHALAIARQRYELEVHVQLTTTLSNTIKHGVLDLEILAPSPELAAAGPGGLDMEGRRLSANTMSAVIRITRAGEPLALLAGDIDAVGLANLEGDHAIARAPVLVFPHHGGLPGSHSPREFARRLCSLVEPTLVVFSIGRNNKDTPRPEIVHAVLECLEDTHIMCTQLSQHCSARMPALASEGRSKPGGFGSTLSCAGKVVLDLSVETPVLTPPVSQHANFVATVVAHPICQRP